VEAEEHTQDQVVLEVQVVSLLQFPPVQVQQALLGAATITCQAVSVVEEQVLVLFRAAEELEEFHLEEQVPLGVMESLL
jgi:hypothetical protein